MLLAVDDLWHALNKSPENDGFGKLLIVIQDHGVTGHVGIGINARSSNGIRDERHGTCTSMGLMTIRSIVRSFPTDVWS